MKVIKVKQEFYTRQQYLKNRLRPPGIFLSRSIFFIEHLHEMRSLNILLKYLCYLISSADVDMSN